jgi:glycosyltransferase involved in cell wall biosynthesis
MVPTESLRRRLHEMGFRNLRVVARGVDTKLFDPARRSEALRRHWRVTDDSPVAVYVGRLAAEKNLRVLVEAYEAMHQEHPSAKLVLVGDGPMRNALQSRIPDAIFAGVRRSEALAEHYASGDIFLFPSVTETFGNVTPEAMASGLAVVAYDYAAAAQLIVDGESGRLAPLGNAAAFTAAAVDVVRNFPSAQRMGVNARHVAEALDWEKLISELEAVFRAVAQMRPSLSAAPFSLVPE